VGVAPSAVQSGAAWQTLSAKSESVDPDAVRSGSMQYPVAHTSSWSLHLHAELMAFTVEAVALVRNVYAHAVAASHAVLLTERQVPVPGVPWQK
jgi:hypothetical protein